MFVGVELGSFASNFVVQPINVVSRRNVGFRETTNCD